MQQYIGGFVNAVALSALFLYQRYRLRLLSESLQKQGALLEETKNVVSQQSTAITSQSTVVDAAVKYSQAFSPERIEQMVRRELEVEHRSEKYQLEQKVKELSAHGGATKLVLEEIGNKVAGRVAEFFTPVLVRYSIYLLSMPEEKRIKEIESIEVPGARQMVAAITKKGSEMLAAAQKECAP